MDKLAGYFGIALEIFIIGGAGLIAVITLFSGVPK